MDAHSHILNEPEWTSLLSSQVYFKESDLGLKKLNNISCEVLTSPENSTRGLLTVFNELKGEHKECSKCEETGFKGRRNYFQAQGIDLSILQGT